MVGSNGFSCRSIQVSSAEGQAVEEYVHHAYDVTSDGQRFLMLEPVSASENRLVVVQGLFELLEEQAGR